jgi:uncharacterized protein
LHIEFDPAKDQLNVVRHGMPLSLAAELEWDDALVWIDERFSYDELRMTGLVPRGERLYFVAFVDRGELRRVISLRHAEPREIKRYVETFR